MVDHDATSEKRVPLPAWEEMPPRNVPDFFGLMAHEVWHRTGEAAAAAQMAEAILAAMRDGRPWWPLTEIGDLAYAQGMVRAEQAAFVGFYAGAIIHARGDTTMTAEEICIRTMQEAGFTPISPEVRVECEARMNVAQAECKRLDAARSAQTTKGESS